MSAKDWLWLVIGGVIIAMFVVMMNRFITQTNTNTSTARCAASGYAGSTWVGPVRYCWEPLGNGELHLVPYSVVEEQ